MEQSSRCYSAVDRVDGARFDTRRDKPRTEAVCFLVEIVEVSEPDRARNSRLHEWMHNSKHR